MRIVPHYEVKLYIGSETFFDEIFSQEDIEKFIGEVQDDYGFIVPVRVTPVTFVSGSLYKEEGWEVAAINYPKVRATEKRIKDFMMDLGRLLLVEFNQERICVMDGESITMLQGLKY